VTRFWGFGGLNIDLSRLSVSQLQWLDRATKRLNWLEEKAAAENSLIAFIRQAWHIVEPGQHYIHGWHIDCLAEHLEAVTNGEINRFLANVPPGAMKSLLVSVFWPAWEWGPRNLAHYRYIGASHAQSLAIRDATKMRRLVSSDWYQSRWGDRVKLTRDVNAKTKFENEATGFREATAADTITGSRGDRVIIDDPHSVSSAASDAERASTIEWFLEAVPTRLNNPVSSAIVVIMQRLHEEDVSGVIIDKELGYTHLLLPMEYDPALSFYSGISFEDPRTEEGELLFPERFPREVVERDKRVMGSYAVSGQFQQSPAPRGGGIIKREHWQLWDDAEAQLHGCKAGTYPPFEYVVASLDTAYTEKEENDPSALTVWGVWIDRHEHRRLMLVSAWTERLELNALVDRAAATCTKFKCDRLLIEAKASGLSVAQEIRRLYGRENWSVQTFNPGNADKVARAYAVQGLFESGLIYAPNRLWAETVINQCSIFPKGKHDDLVDTVTMALHHLRLINMAELPSEQTMIIEDSIRDWKQPQPLYGIV